MLGSILVFHKNQLLLRFMEQLMPLAREIVMSATAFSRNPM